MNNYKKSITLIASIITIFVFITGISSLIKDDDNSENELNPEIIFEGRILDKDDNPIENIKLEISAFKKAYGISDEFGYFKFTTNVYTRDRPKNCVLGIYESKKYEGLTYSVPCNTLNGVDFGNIHLKEK